MEGGIMLTAEKRKNLEALSHDGACKRAKAELGCMPDDEVEESDVCHTTLLHLSDDVLLNIFRYCSPTDIRALSLCNTRLNGLCLDRSLWRRVDMRERRMGVKTFSLYLNSLPKHTTQSLCVRGLVGSYKKSSDKSNQKKDAKSDKKESKKSEDETQSSSREDGQSCSTSQAADATNPDVETCGDGEMMYNVVKESGNSSPKPFSRTYDVQSSSGPLSSSRSGTKNSKGNSSKNGEGKNDDEGWTVTNEMMTTIRKKCPDLKELRLEFCYIDCNAIQSSTFPSTLETLSLRGSVCRNVPLARAYLFRLQEHCPKLSEIDLSRCDWLASHSLLVLSKVPTLKRLSLKHCWGLGECVAYASLSARYGFKSLETLDIRGTPMGDSEITAFSLIGPLKELLLQGSGVVEDILKDPLLRNRMDVGDPLPWETQDPALYGEGWNWSSESEDEKEPEPQEEREPAPSNAPNIGDPMNALAQLGEEGVDPFEAVGRVHVIYVDVRRAPINNMLRVRYQGGQDQPDNAPPQQAPGVEVHINNPAEENREEEGNAMPQVQIHREGDNRINFHVHYGNDVMVNIGPRVDVVPEGAEYREVQVERHEQFVPQREDHPFHQEILRHINFRDQLVGEMHRMHRRHIEHLHANNALHNIPPEIRNAPDFDNGEDFEFFNADGIEDEHPNPANGDQEEGRNPEPPNDNQERNNGNQVRNEEEPGRAQPNPENLEENQNYRPPPRLLARLQQQQINRRGNAMQRLLQLQQANARDEVTHLLHDFKHTMRQLENYVAKVRTTDVYDRYVRRIQFFRRMLQQIFTNESLFNTNRAIPEQRVALQRDLVSIRRLIDTSCQHLERLIARAIRYPADETPFSINYNLIDNPEQAEDQENNDNDVGLRPETVEFYIQRYFGVPPAEEVNVNQEPMVRMFERNIPAPEEIAGIVNNIHDIIHERVENNQNPANNAENQNANANNQEQQEENGRQNNGDEPGRLVNIRNINIEIREHNVQVPIIPAGELNPQRHIDQQIERVVNDELRALQQEHQQRRNRNNDPRAGDDRIRIEGPFVIRGDVMEDGGRRRRRVVHFPLHLNIRGQMQHNNVNDVGTSHLVTDASLLRFGVSKNIVHIGGDAHMQPQTTTRGGQLTTLVCRGYPRVTDRALLHLAAAAPNLTRLDLSYTSVTRAGAETFRADRHDCELIVDHLQGDEE